MSLKRLSFREVRRKLLAAGFKEISQRGSHVKFALETKNGTRITIVPNHDQVAVGTLRSIVKQAGLTVDEFEKF